MNGIGIESNAPLVASDLIARGLRAEAKAGVAVRTFGSALRDRVRTHASGRPGPNVNTGAYLESIGVEYESRFLSYRAVVFTNAPQGRRLELGFVGTDSTGRSYHQPPFPHFGPAMREIEAPFIAAVAAGA